MDIIVCIKQVPDTTEVRINPETNTLVREGVKSIINPFDLYALEEGIRIKEKFRGKVTVLSMGPPQVEEALREAIAMGTDEAVLLSDRAFAGADTLATSYTLAIGIKKIGKFDLIICGKQAIDGDTAQVGPGISVQLNIPQITYVRKIEEIRPKSTASEHSSIKVERMTEEGYDVVESPLPALLTVVKEINEPRLPSLKGKLRAKKVTIPVWNSQDLGVDEQYIGLDGSPTRVIKIFSPPARTKGQILTGGVKTAVEKLAELLKKR